MGRFQGVVAAFLVSWLMMGCAVDSYPQFTGVFHLQSIAITGSQGFSVPLPNSVAVETAGSGSMGSTNLDLHFRFFEDSGFSRPLQNRSSSAPLEAEVTQAVSALVNCAELRETEGGGAKCVTPPLTLAAAPGISLGEGCSFSMQTSMMVYLTPDPLSLMQFYSAAGASDEKLKRLSPGDFQFHIVIQRRPVEMMPDCTASNANYLRAQAQQQSFDMNLRYIAVTNDSSTNPLSREGRQRTSSWHTSAEFTGLPGYFSRVLERMQ